jgi:hypothetical protein
LISESLVFTVSILTGLLFGVGRALFVGVLILELKAEVNISSSSRSLKLSGGNLATVSIYIKSFKNCYWS